MVGQTADTRQLPRQVTRLWNIKLSVSGLLILHTLIIIIIYIELCFSLPHHNVQTYRAYKNNLPGLLGNHWDISNTLLQKQYNNLYVQFLVILLLWCWNFLLVFWIISQRLMVVRLNNQSSDEIKIKWKKRYLDIVECLNFHTLGISLLASTLHARVVPYACRIEGISYWENTSG